MRPAKKQTFHFVFSAFFFAAAIALSPLSAPSSKGAEPTPIQGNLASLGVFKNGIVVVEEKFVVPGPGRYAVSAPPSPIHGAFFVASDAKIETTATTRDVEIPISEAKTFDWTTDFVGRAVRVRLPGEDAPRTVRIIPTGKVDENAANPNSAAPLNSRWNGGGTESVLLQGESGETILLSAAAAAQATVVALAEEKKLETVVRKKPLLIFDVAAKTPGAPGANAAPERTIRLFYLARGATWAPQYRVELKDAKTLEIEQTALLANEFRSFENVPLALFSGFPQIQMQNVLSPLAPGVDLATFFATLTSSGGDGASFYRRGELGQTTMNQAIVSNFAPRDLGSDFGAASGESAAFGEGVDVFAQNVGAQTLAKNDRKQFAVATKTVPCRRVVCWNISDARDANGRFLNGANPTSDQPIGLYGRTTSGEVSLDNSNRFAEPWDAIQFNNPFDFPITTGPATVLSGSKFLGQNALFWTNPGEEALLPITKALSVRVRSVENERYFDENSEKDAQGGAAFHSAAGNPERFAYFEHKLAPEFLGKTILVRNSYFRVAVVDATITLANNRAEETTVLLSRQFSGVALPDSFDGFDETPKSALLGDAAGNYYSGAFNRRHELRWTTTLQPNEKRTLKFSYQTLIAQ